MLDLTTPKARAQWFSHTFKISLQICEGGCVRARCMNFAPPGVPLAQIFFRSSLCCSRAIAAPHRSAKDGPEVREGMGAITTAGAALDQEEARRRRRDAIRVVAVIIVFIVSIGLLALTSHWMTLELIVQPAAKDAIGEMGVRSG
jgi:hypothetical protein